MSLIFQCKIHRFKKSHQILDKIFFRKILLEKLRRRRHVSKNHKFSLRKFLRNKRTKIEKRLKRTMEQVVAMFRYILEWASSKDGEKWPVEKAKKKGDHVLNAMSREVTPERNPVIERLLWRGRRGCSSETRLFQLREFLVHAARTV